MNEKLIELAKAAGFGVDGKGLLFTLGFANSQAYCTDKLERFAELVREDERKSKWLPIETAPNDFCTTVDLWRGERIPDCVWDHPDGSPQGYFAWCKYVYEIGFGQVLEEVKNATHWMSQPKAPPQESEAQDDPN